MKKTKIKSVPISFLKRLFDIVFALVLLIITLPLFIVIALAIFVEHFLKGQPDAKLFYREKRITEGREFNFTKFNVYDTKLLNEKIKNGEDFYAKQLEWENGLSRVGRVVQRVYLDELPQVFNILKGDMSVVGPRPVCVKVHKKMLKQGETAKDVIRAGLTGPYQSHKGEPGMGQSRLDNEYIEFCRNNPAWKIVLKDIGIILRTLKIIFRAQGL